MLQDAALGQKQNTENGETYYSTVSVTNRISFSPYFSEVVSCQLSVVTAPVYASPALKTKNNSSSDVTELNAGGVEEEISRLRTTALKHVSIVDRTPADEVTACRRRDPCGTLGASAIVGLTQ